MLSRPWLHRPSELITVECLPDVCAAEPPISVAVVMQSLQTAIKARQTRGAAAASSRTAELASLQDAAAKVSRAQLHGSAPQPTSTEPAESTIAHAHPNLACNAYAPQVYRLFSSPDSLHAAFWHDSSAQASQGGPKQPPIVVDLTLEDDDSSSSQLRAGLSQQGVNSGRPVAASPAGEAESGVTQTEQGVSATSQQGSQQQSEQVATGSTASQGQGQIAQRQPSTQGAGGEPSRDLSGRLMSGDSVRIVSGDSNVQVGDATAADAPEASSDSSVQVVSSRDGSQDSDDVITTAETDACMAVSMLDTVDTVRQTVATADVEATTREMEQQVHAHTDTHLHTYTQAHEHTEQQVRTMLTHTHACSFKHADIASPMQQSKHTMHAVLTELRPACT